MTPPGAGDLSQWSVRNVVLVHGAYADGSSWSAVVERLHAVGLTATAVQNPLSSLADDVAHTVRILDLQDEPTILVGHSFAGTVITQAGVDPRVAGLVYVAARAPDAGEDYAALAKRFPEPPPTLGSSSRTDSVGLPRRPFSMTSQTASSAIAHARSTPCRDASRRCCSMSASARLPGEQSQAGTRSQGTIAPPRLIWSGFSPNAWAPRPWKSTRATSP